MAIDALMSLPKRGPEIGGLLLGRKRSDEPGVLRIDAFEEIPCEHRYGPSYVLSADDRSGLSEALQRRRPEGSPVVVGFFRSYSRRDPTLKTADVELLRTYFPEDTFAFLLLQPLTSSECRAVFLFGKDGELPTESPYPSFDFDSESLEKTDGILPARSGPVHPPQIISDHAVVAEPPVTVEVPVAIEAPISAIQGDTPATNGAATDAFVQAPLAPPLPAPPLSTQAPPPLPSFVLPYRPTHREEEASAAPKRVWLTLVACMLFSIVSVGIYELWTVAREPRWSDLKLDASQVAGRIELYWDRSAADVILASRGSLLVSDGELQKKIELSRSEIRAGKFAYQPVHDDLRFRLEIFGSSIKPSGDSLRMVMAQAPPQAAVAEPAAQQPAAVAPVHNATPPAPSATRPASRTGESSRSIIPPAQSTTKNAEPAAALHEVQPEISEGIRSRIEGRVVVPVEVRISDAGSVTDAVAKGNGDSVYRYLAEQAVKAARSWRFSAAKSQWGTAVASRKTLEFVFTPPGQ